MPNTVRKPKHIHKFKRHTYPTGGKIFFCTLPDCQFKIETALAVGKEVLCNVCSNPFILTVAHLDKKLPHCPSCGKMRVKIDGKVKYVNKIGLSQELLQEMAQDTTKSLRDRLDALTNPDTIEDEEEKDI